MTSALADAKVDVERVNYINAHATSTPVGDMAEINALKKIFVKQNHIVVNATKSMIGHSLGAAGGLEAIATIKAILTGRVHPTINLENPEAEVLDFHLPTVAEEHKIDVALSNSFGFGGHNASLVLSSFR